MAVSGGDDRTVKLWDLAQKQCIFTFSDHLDTVNKVKFHPDGTCIAAGSADRKIKVWDIRSQRLLQHYDAHADSVTSISFHPSGMYLLSSSNDSTLKIWDLRQGHILYTLYGHQGQASIANFSKDGDYFASGGSDNLVMIWKSNIDIDAKPEIERPQRPKKSMLSEIEVNKISTAKKTDKEFTFSPQKAESSFEEIIIEDVKVPLPGFLGLPAEVAETLQKIESQLELLTRVLVNLEKKVTYYEDRMLALSAYFSDKSRTVSG